MFKTNSDRVFGDTGNDMWLLIGHMIITDMLQQCCGMPTLRGAGHVASSLVDNARLLPSRMSMHANPSHEAYMA